MKELVKNLSAITNTNKEKWGAAFQKAAMKINESDYIYLMNLVNQKRELRHTNDN
ncbi:hypothetical protein [Paenibacillus massiliensis]|uniref:hypothetical protein n=1 Tax=Paenibacillus massiliensis TaxID=225917 RepID=UPI0004B6E570|nr:hypothetical protein [Paenibacillus massiliensis]